MKLVRANRFIPFDHVWVPASPKLARTKQKVMVVLHGRGDSLHSFLSIHSELELPHVNYLLINAPRRLGDGFSWYPLEPRHRGGVRAARQYLFRLVDQLKSQGWSARDILWMGHSQGCLVACDLVLNHPESFAGLIGVSGYLWFFRGWKQKIENSGARRTPWLMTHGTRDRVISPREIREDILELSNARIPLLYREFSKGHDFDYREEMPFIRSWILKSHSSISTHRVC